MPHAVPTHRPARPPLRRDHRTYDRTRRDLDAKRFYRSDGWQRLRAAKLAETPYCEACMQEDRLVAAIVVHHVRELREDPDARLDIANLQSLCQSCHSRIHARKSTSARRIDDQITPPGRISEPSCDRPSKVSTGVDPTSGAGVPSIAVDV